MTTPILVEGLDVSAYGITRALGPYGARVTALNHDRRDLLRYSRYCRETLVFDDDPLLPRSYAGDVRANPGRLRAQLLEWARRQPAPPVAFATSDWFTEFLAREQASLAPHLRFHWISPELYDTIVDKGRMARFCSQHGITVPRTHATQPTDQPTALAQTLPFPCIIKPLHRSAGRFPVESAKAVIARNPAELTAFFQAHPAALGATLIQELVEGADDEVFQCTVLVGCSGELLAQATVRKLQQYPAGFGSMCHGRLERNDEMARQALQLVRALGYRGLGSLEFKRRASDGRYYFIEMNTRLPWYNGLFAAGGVNFAAATLADLTRTPLPAPTGPQRDGTTWAAFRQCRQRRRAALSPSPSPSVSPSPSPSPSLAATITSATAHAWWNPADPAPFAASGIYAARRAAGAILRRLRG